MVAPVKGAELLITALPALRAGSPDARLALVGPVDAGYADHLRALAETVGVGDALEITGAVGDADYQRRLAEVTVAVQLRLGTNGESSAAVLDCLAAGTPVITNVAAATELPPGTVDLVPYDLDAARLAAHLLHLLGDPARLTALGEAGPAYAASWTADDVVDRLLAAVASLP
jgi:glycosyltransferase involved in cell wall biosynthesis